MSRIFGNNQSYLKTFLVRTLIEISVSVISYLLSFLLLAYQLCKSCLIHYVSDMTIHTNIDFIGLYLVIAFIERLISTVCDRLAILVCQ